MVIKSLLILMTGFVLFVSCAEDGDKKGTACTSLDCKTKKYSLLMANLDGSNIEVIKTSSYQDMTHPRVSADKKWLGFTTYNKINSSGCATVDQDYVDTEIRAVKMDGSSEVQLIAPASGELNSNIYWVGETNEFTFLSGLPSAGTKIYKATVDSNMNLISGPTEVSVPGTILPLDPAAHKTTDKIVYPGIYNSGGEVKSIFIMNFSDSSSVVGLTLGRDSAGTTLYGTDVLENDPKLSPNGDKVAFMRLANKSGATGFGWHIFVVPVASPLAEVDISMSALGSSILNNDTLPEWLDNDTLIFSKITVSADGSFVRTLHTMKDDGSQRSDINLPAGYHYAGVYPFTNSSGQDKMILSVEKISATCSQ